MFVVAACGLGVPREGMRAGYPAREMYFTIMRMDTSSRGFRWAGLLWRSYNSIVSARLRITIVRHVWTGTMIVLTLAVSTSDDRISASQDR